MQSKHSLFFFFSFFFGEVGGGVLPTVLHGLITQNIIEIHKKNIMNSAQKNYRSAIHLR